jgi:hypothetical protein
MDYRRNLRHIVGNKVVGYRNSKVLEVTDEGKVHFEYERAPGIKAHEIKDLAEIKIQTITGH